MNKLFFSASSKQVSNIGNIIYFGKSCPSYILGMTVEGQVLKKNRMLKDVTKKNEKVILTHFN